MSKNAIDPRDELNPAPRFLVLILLALAALGSGRLCEARTPHPMDALSGEELAAALAILEAQGLADESSRYPLLLLDEPAKETVVGWSAGQAVARAAFVVQRHGGRTFEGVVDLSGGRVASWRELEDAEPGLLAEEVSSVTEIVAADPEAQEALRLRGVRGLDELRCLPLPAEGRRLVRAACWDGKDKNNVFSRPVGGLHFLVDLDRRAVVEVVDREKIPLATGDQTYDAATMATRKRLKPVVQARPAGANFTLDGGSVRWQSWSFHVRLERRRGLVVSLVRYWDRGQRRSVLYQGSLAEVFVPYQDARFPRALTATAWGLDPSPLAAGLDCPETAALIDAVVADERGRPRRVAGALAVFERNPGGPLWRHEDVFNKGEVESRAAVELVARAIFTLGPHDYQIDWVFTLDGRIRVEVGVSGLLLNYGVRTVRLNEPTAADDTAYGTLVTGNVVAPNLEHWLSFRLDLDVDGQANSFVREDLKVVATPEDPRRRVWVVEPHVARTEAEAKLRTDPARPAVWRVIHPDKKTDVGHRPGYALEPLGSGGHVVDREAPAAAGGFTEYNLWVTPYRADELFAADLPRWTRAARPIENADLVLWYTLGFQHVPRLEDFPVVPTLRRSFELRPFHFFERNPAVDLRPEFEGSDGGR